VVENTTCPNSFFVRGSPHRYCPKVTETKADVLLITDGFLARLLWIMDYSILNSNSRRSNMYSLFSICLLVQVYNLGFFPRGPISGA
jgi:hypothetical protein